MNFSVFKRLIRTFSSVLIASLVILYLNEIAFQAKNIQEILSEKRKYRDVCKEYLKLHKNCCLT